MRPNPVMGFVWLFLALCAGGVGALTFGSEYIWVESTQGRVAELIHSKGTAHAMCTPVFEYEVDGRTVRRERDVRESACGWSEGEELTIYYRANAPEKGYALTFFGLVPGLIGLVITLVLLQRSYRRFRGRAPTRQERLARAPVVKLADAPPGELVGVRGKLTPLRDLDVAPMTGRDCIAWQLDIHRYFGSSSVLMRRDVGMKPFQLDDGEHQAVVDSGQPFSALLASDESGRTKTKLWPKLSEFLRSKGVSKKKIDVEGDADYEWQEGVVPVGGEATVYAVVAPHADGYRFEPPGAEGKIVVVTEDLSAHKAET